MSSGACTDIPSFSVKKVNEISGLITINSEESSRDWYLDVIKYIDSL